MLSSQILFKMRQHRKKIRLRHIGKGFYVTLLLEKYGHWLIFELKRFFVPLIIFIIIVGSLIFLSTQNVTWHGWKLSSGFYNHVFCEEIRSGPIRQPLNAWSSLVFIPIGLWIARRAFLDYQRASHAPPIRRHKEFGLLYGFSLVVLGIGSWFFHASLTYVGHFLDVVGMYFLGGFLFTYGLSRKFRRSALAFLTVYSSVVLPLVFFQWFHPAVSRYAFGALIAAALIIEIALHGSLSNKLFIAALVCAGLGFSLWVLDERGLLCWPESCFQGHAIWHILTGISAQLAYLYYLSAAPRVKKWSDYPAKFLHR